MPVLRIIKIVHSAAMALIMNLHFLSCFKATRKNFFYRWYFTDQNTHNLKCNSTVGFFFFSKSWMWKILFINTYLYICTTLRHQKHINVFQTIPKFWLCFSINKMKTYFGSFQATRFVSLCIMQDNRKPWLRCQITASRRS